jgi:chromosomal replication initiator protein
LSGPIELIINAVSEEFGISSDELLSRDRSVRFSHPRLIAMGLARQLTKASFPEIAKEFAGRHHSTIVSGARRGRDLTDSCPEYLDKKNAVMRRLSIEPSP